MKNHLKSIAAPKSWILNRKRTFVVRPNPGAHAFEFGLPLSLILRDYLKLASTTDEVKKILNNNLVLVDGKRRKDHRFMVGLFDVISISDLNKHFRVVFDFKGRLTIVEIVAQESTLKICKVTGKTILPKGKVQLHLHDGKNILSTQKVKVGDSLLLNIPQLELKTIFPLQEGAVIFLIGGKNKGDLGVLREIKANEIIYETGGQKIETAKRYLFVIGAKEALIKVRKEIDLKA